MNSELTPSQLADLLNYVLELPKASRSGQIMRDRISPVVTRSWVEKWQRRQSRIWCESVLRQEGILPKREGHHKAGRKPVMVAELRFWIEKPWERRTA